MRMTLKTMTMNQTSPIDWIPVMKEVVYAASTSPDPSTQVAATICKPDGRMMITPVVNNFTKGVAQTSERWNNRDKKYHYVEHAERAAIYQCAKIGVPTANMVLVGNWLACCDCARGIVSAGIKKVVCLNRVDCSRWGTSTRVGDEILTSAGVEMEFIDHHFGVDLLRSGKTITV